MFRRCLLLCTAFCLVFVTAAMSAETRGTIAAARRLILAHYMPWYEAKPASASWGWHWTMNHFDPEKMTAGRREVASHFYPLIGPYDSGDPHVLEYHLLTMKLAGIDGVIVDWYGLSDFRDYPILHRHTTRLLETAERLKAKFVICYEDQTIPALVDAKRITAADRVSHAAKEIQWLNRYWFKSPSYGLLDGKPVLLSFGHAGLTDDEWSQCLNQALVPLTYFSQQRRRAAAVGAFDWPVPSDALTAFERFHNDARRWPQAIPVVFPRFVDIYAEAKVGPSYGRLDDDQGKSFRKMLERALKSKAAVVQLATWNDWGEGTIIEPSREFGYRDLEAVQELRRQHCDPRFSPTPADLRLPQQLLALRRRTGGPDHAKQLDRIAELLAAGESPPAQSLLEALLRPR